MSGITHFPDVQLSQFKPTVRTQQQVVDENRGRCANCFAKNVEKFINCNFYIAPHKTQHIFDVWEFIFSWVGRANWS